jgi:hypothetical protein
MTFEQWRTEYVNKHGVLPREVDAWNAGKNAERERWMEASSAVSAGAEAAGRPGVQTVTQIRLLALGPNASMSRRG